MVGGSYRCVKAEAVDGEVVMLPGDALIRDKEVQR